jgi:hypothetical protein
MPRCFFNIMDGRSAPDLCGTELPDIYAAQAEAIRASADMLREMGARFWDGTEWAKEVKDETEHPLFTLRFSAEEHGT